MREREREVEVEKERRRRLERLKAKERGILRYVCGSMGGRGRVRGE